jgi:guanine deaminase
MAKAIQISLENIQSTEGGPFGAVVVRDGKVIATGSNRVTPTNDPTAHAEVVAIRAACATLGTFDLSDCDIYSSCEPCPMCLGAIYWARIRRVYYACVAQDAATAGFSDALIYREIAKPLPDREIPFIQMMREEALVTFRKWLANPDRVNY